MRIIILPALVFFFSDAYPQFSVGNGSQVSAGNALFATNSDILLQPGHFNLENATLRLTGLNQSTKTETPVTLGTLEVFNGGDKILIGTWEVLNELKLTDGYLVPDKSQSGKIIFYGISQIQPEGWARSYVKGEFINKSIGKRNFPVGNASGYFPAYLRDIVDVNFETGMEVFSTRPPGTPISDQSLNIFQQRYWNLNTSGQQPVSFFAGLDLTGTNGSQSHLAEFDLNGKFISASESVIVNGFLESTFPINSETRILTLAARDTEFNRLIIHNLITPNHDNENDFLFIEFIEKYPENSVKLFDRWGLLIREWLDFQNEEDFDFSSLSTGSYLCILESMAGGNKKIVKQVITILK
jgi:gliding motility-associated-like protein